MARRREGTPHAKYAEFERRGRQVKLGNPTMTSAQLSATADCPHRYFLRRLGAVMTLRQKSSH
jgi:hypothetical protein